MLCVELGNIDLDLEKLDKIIYDCISSGLLIIIVRDNWWKENKCKNEEYYNDAPDWYEED